MKQIQILGTGCTKCNQLADAVKVVIVSEGIEADVQKVEDIEQIVSYGVMSTPGLVVDGVLVSTGKVPLNDELRVMLTAAPKSSGCCGGPGGNCCS